MESSIVFKGKDGALPAKVEITVADIKKYIAPKASDQELYLFVNIARSQGLDPFKREIHFVPFKDRHSIVVGYETYIKRMEASGLCEGWKVEVRNEGQDNEEYVFITWRKGWKEPFEWPVKTNRFVKRYAGSPWETMPEHMKRKTAISQGARMAYADVIGGLPYTAEEVQSYGEAISAEFEVQGEEAETGTVSLDALTEAPPEPEQPTEKEKDGKLTAAEIEERIKGAGPIEAPKKQPPNPIYELEKIYKQALIVRADLDAALRLCNYDLMDDPANIKNQVKSAKATEWRVAVGALLNWMKGEQ